MAMERGSCFGRVDMVIMRIVDLNLAFPLILLALAVVALLGANLRNLVIVMAITTWMIYARVVRGVSLTLEQEAWVRQGRAVRVIPEPEPGLIAAKDPLGRLVAERTGVVGSMGAHLRVERPVVRAHGYHLQGRIG